MRCSSSSKKLLQANTGPPLSSSGKVDGDAHNNIDSTPPPESEGASATTGSVDEKEPSRCFKEDATRTRRDAQKELEDTFAPFRYVYPEFLPEPNLRFRNKIKEKLERLDMLHRRSHIDIPEFYVGKL